MRRAARRRVGVGSVSTDRGGAEGAVGTRQVLRPRVASSPGRVSRLCKGAPSSSPRGRRPLGRTRALRTTPGAADAPAHAVSAARDGRATAVQSGWTPPRREIGHCARGVGRHILKSRAASRETRRMLGDGPEPVASPSSRGPGFSPFKAETRVRIPLGTPISLPPVQPRRNTDRDHGLRRREPPRRAGAIGVDGRARRPAGAVTLSRGCGTTVDDLWDAVTNRQRIPRWFLPVHGDLEPGGRYRLEGKAGVDELHAS